MLSIADYFDIGINLLKVKCLRRFNVAPPPRVIAYTVTWRCNAACEMCGIKDVDKRLKNRENELGVKDIMKIFRDPLLKKLDLIRFTGGEPFLKEDFIDIVEEISKNTRAKIYYITTNGFYTQKILNFVERLAPRTSNLVIQISLDAIGEMHDNIRKVPGLYDKIFLTLQGLKNLRNKYDFTFGINQTITPHTVNYLDEISKLCSNFKCDHKVYLAHKTHESHILEGEKLSSKLALISDPEKDAIKSLFNRIEEHRKKENKKKRFIFSPENLWEIVERYILLGSKNRLLKGYAFPNPPCLTMFFYLRLLPDGTVMPCTLKPKPMGNLKNQTFTEIWYSKIAQDMRTEVRNCEGCWVECDIVPNIIYSFDSIKEICKELFSFHKK